MFASLGYRVASLKRIRMGSLLLGELLEGKMRVLSKAEVTTLSDSKISLILTEQPVKKKLLD